MGREGRGVEGGLCRKRGGVLWRGCIKREGCL